MAVSGRDGVENRAGLRLYVLMFPELVRNLLSARFDAILGCLARVALAVRGKAEAILEKKEGERDAIGSGFLARDPRGIPSEAACCVVLTSCPAGTPQKPLVVLPGRWIA